MSAVQLTQKCTGADRRGNLKDEIHSVVGQKIRGFCSCPKVPGNGVVMIIGWQIDLETAFHHHNTRKEGKREGGGRERERAEETAGGGREGVGEGREKVAEKQTFSLL